MLLGEGVGADETTSPQAANDPGEPTRTLAFPGVERAKDRPMKRARHRAATALVDAPRLPYGPVLLMTLPR